MNDPRISVVVPVRNKIGVLAAALDSVLAAVRNHPQSELILVDNGSTDGSTEILASRYGADARILTLVPGTIAAVRNHGARHATGTHLWFVDADCVVPKDYLDRLVEIFRTTGSQVTGCEVMPPAAASRVEDVWFQAHCRPRDGDQEWIGSANLAMTRAAFEAVGGFDERLVSGEDAELCQRLRSKGFRIFEAKRLSVVHLDNAKTISAFFRKEVWRGLGMFGTARGSAFDKPTVMTVLHLTLCVVALGVLLGSGLELPWRLALGGGLTLAAPVMTVAYRAFGNRRIYQPLYAVLLYEVYYAARITALIELCAAKWRDGGAVRDRPSRR